MKSKTYRSRSWEYQGAKKDRRKIVACGLCVKKLKKGEPVVIVHRKCLGESMG